MSLGGSRSKTKESSAGESTVNPYAPTEPYIDEILRGAKAEYDKGNKDYLGGFDYSKLYQDPTNEMLEMERTGANAYKQYNNPDAFKDITSTYNSYLNGDPTTAGGSYLSKLTKDGITGTSLDAFNNGTGANAYDMMSPDGGKTYLDEYLKNTTDQISNSVGADFALNGRYGGGASYANNVGAGVTAEAMPLMMEMANAERDRQFTGNTDFVTNQYNAGNEINQSKLYAGSNLNNIEARLLEGRPAFDKSLYDLANNSMEDSYGYAGMDNMRKDRTAEMDMSKAMYDQDAYQRRLMDFEDIIGKYAFGLPNKITTGNSSGKSTSFGFGIG